MSWRVKNVWKCKMPSAHLIMAWDNFVLAVWMEKVSCGWNVRKYDGTGTWKLLCQQIYKVCSLVRRTKWFGVAWRDMKEMKWMNDDKCLLKIFILNSTTFHDEDVVSHSASWLLLCVLLLCGSLKILWCGLWHFIIIVVTFSDFLESRAPSTRDQCCNFMFIYLTKDVWNDFFIYLRARGENERICVKWKSYYEDFNVFLHFLSVILSHSFKLFTISHNY